MGRKGRERARDWRSRRRWTAEEAREALAAAEESGQSLRVFAAEHGLEVHRLSRWRRRLQGAVRPEAPAFEEVPASGLEEAKRLDLRERFEIVLRSGRVVRVSESFEADALRRLLSVVDEERPC